MIIQPSDEKLIEIYRCGVCRHFFRRGARMHVSCCVMHEPGTCCHYGDVILDEAQVLRIGKILEEERVK